MQLSLRMLRRIRWRLRCGQMTCERRLTLRPKSERVRISYLFLSLYLRVH